MAEIKTITLNYKEVVEAMIKHQGIHEGLWQLYVEFGIAAANLPIQNQVSPCAIIPIKKIGLHKVDKENPLTINASEVNPK